MRFSFITLFPEIVEGYFRASIMHRALESGIISVDFYNPRDYSTNRYKKVDEPMIGGGAGMLMSPQPLDDAISDIRGKSPQAYVLFLSPAGKPFNQNDARRLSAKKHIVLVAGRYEGIDERVLELQADEVVDLKPGRMKTMPAPDEDPGAEKVRPAVSKPLVAVPADSTSRKGEQLYQERLRASAKWLAGAYHNSYKKY